MLMKEGKLLLALILIIAVVHTCSKNNDPRKNTSFAATKNIKDLKQK
jgi:hypothetical protein